ncbi:MAG: hypothetical protein ACK504_04540 [Bacteroidota bacterium]
MLYPYYNTNKLNEISIQGGAVYFSGTGKVFVPLFGSLINVTFNNVFVDDNQTVLSGNFYAATKGVTNWVKDYELTQIDNTYNGNVDSVKVNTDGTITIYGSNGKSKQTPISYPYVVKDSQGNTWEVYGNGNVIQSHNTQYEDIVCVKENSTKYYLKTDNDTTRFFENAAVFRLKNFTENITLKLFNTNNTTLNNDSIYWKIEGKKKCERSTQCTWALSKSNDYKIVIYKGNKPLFKCRLIVYDSPLIVFEKGTNYNGEYGFDDGYKYSPITGDYPMLELPNINGSIISIPYFSIKPNQSVTLNLNALKTKAIANGDFEIRFGSTEPSKIKINGSVDKNITLQNLVKNPSITITTDKFENYISERVEYIFAINSKNDTIGKIAISCFENTKIRKLALVYVKHKTNQGFRNDLSKQSIANYLNTHSHNQLHVKWEVATTSLNYVDTLNISEEYANHWQNFQNSSGYSLTTLKGLYCQKYNITLDPSYNYFFITNISVTNEDGATVGGRNVFEQNYGVLFNSILPYNEVLAHELGHALNLRHTFDSFVGTKLIPKSTTINFMDYINSGRNTWFRYQFIFALPQIK